MKVQIVDSHTAGEPTRVVVGGFPPLSGTIMAERRTEFERHYDHLRRGIVLEPRGSDVLVGALLTEPTELGSTAGVIFFNNVGMLGMCGHGTIGLIETLHAMGRVGAGRVAIDTPVGTVTAERHTDGSVTLENVASYRTQSAVEVEVAGIGRVVGDVAYGGNWFFLVRQPAFDVRPAMIPQLTQASFAIRNALEAAGIQGDDGSKIDHIELFAAEAPPGADSRSFVLCPGGAFDRSPCGTGTSAKIACLLADGKLAEGEPWVQESVTGGRFVASGTYTEGRVLPRITGRAHITGEGWLHFEESDPYRWGLPQS